MKRRSGNEAGQFFSQDELRALLAVVDDAQDSLIIRTAYAYGLRISEVLTMESQQLSDGRLLICTSKKGVRQSVPLESGLLDVADDLQRVAMLRPRGPLFNRNARTLNYRLHGYCKRAGLPARKAHAHTLRHSCAREVLALTRDLCVVQTVLRHKSLSSTGQYLRVTADEAADKITEAKQTKTQAASV
jgi:integrase